MLQINSNWLFIYIYAEILVGRVVYLSLIRSLALNCQQWVRFLCCLLIYCCGRSCGRSSGVVEKSFIFIDNGVKSNTNERMRAKED